MTDKLWNATYWADHLKETTESVAPLRRKLYNMHTDPLTIEEQFMLRHYLDQYASYSTLLHEDMHEEEPKRPLIKKILRKK